MSPKEQILARLNERYQKLSALKSPDKSTKDAFWRTLNALDHNDRTHTVSFYPELSACERAEVRDQWLKLAAGFGGAVTARGHKKDSTHGKLPSRVLSFFDNAAEFISFRPRATNDPLKGMWRTSWKEAQDLMHVDLNPPAHVHWLVFDCDHREYECWRTKGLLEPSFITINPDSGHHHAVYRLSAPVCRSERARYRPLAYLRAVREALREALTGDSGYSNVLTQNPLHPAWKTIRPERMPSYTLAELAETVDLQAAGRANKKSGRNSSSKLADLAEVGVGGRNHALFEAVRHWAYSHAESMPKILDYTEHCNGLFHEPLPHSEVVAISRSIERYHSDRRRLRSLNMPEFRARQAARGRLGGRPQVTHLNQPWLAEGISRSTWYRHKKMGSASSQTQDSTERDKEGVGRPASKKQSYPWLAQGMSRATWYRHRKAEADLGERN